MTPPWASLDVDAAQGSGPSLVARAAAALPAPRVTPYLFTQQHMYVAAMAAAVADHHPPHQCPLWRPAGTALAPPTSYCGQQATSAPIANLAGASAFSQFVSYMVRTHPSSHCMCLQRHMTFVGHPCIRCSPRPRRWLFGFAAPFTQGECRLRYLSRHPFILWRPRRRAMPALTPSMAGHGGTTHSPWTLALWTLNSSRVESLSEAAVIALASA